LARCSNKNNRENDLQRHVFARISCALLSALTLAAFSSLALAVTQKSIEPLAGDDNDAKIATIRALALDPDAKASAVLNALASDALHALPNSIIAIVDAESARDAETGAALTDKGDAVVLNNRVRGEVQAAIALRTLIDGKADNKDLLATTKTLATAAVPEYASALKGAASKTQSAELRAAIDTALASTELASPNAAERIAAAKRLASTSDAGARRVLSDALTSETDEAVKAAYAAALLSMAENANRGQWAANALMGLSLGSVLLLAALGLAITYGVMGVINMAHGELIMIGAYATWLTQSAFRKWLPEAVDYYLVAAVPAAFLAAAAVGWVIERTVVRHLYNRQLETLLATFGVSLILAQLARTVFGAQNVEVANPTWLSGGVTLWPGLVLPLNRIGMFIFCLAVLAGVALILKRTRFGLYVRAVAQNRRMAQCVGIATARTDAAAFALGSGVAGLAGLAVSQFANVGPDMGQGYIVDSFLVVVVGGVGQLLGSVIAAFGLGISAKIFEGWMGAVIAKVVLLMLIIAFIQWRPHGLFAPKGRQVDAA
jgi:urea transport system permease protein